MNFIELDKLIRTNTCLLNSPLEVMLILGFFLLSLLITLYTSSIFLDGRRGKFSLILTISLILEEDAYAYNYSL